MRKAGSKVREYLWKLVNWVQGWPLWHPKLRTIALRLMGFELDRRARIHEGVYLGGTKLRLGKDVFINVGAFIDSYVDVVLEDFVRVGPYAKILTGTHVWRKCAIRRWPSDETLRESVRIKKGCWVGMGAMILPGVTVSEGCIIAAGAVVTENTEPHGLYAGVPAQRVRDLPVDGEENLPADIRQAIDLG